MIPPYNHLFEMGTLLDWCDALRGSHTGMSDPMPNPEEVRSYIQSRLNHWAAPEDGYDKLVAALCEFCLRTYHVPEPEKRP